MSQITRAELPTAVKASRAGSAAPTFGDDALLLPKAEFGLGLCDADVIFSTDDMNDLDSDLAALVVVRRNAEVDASSIGL